MARTVSVHVEQIGPATGKAVARGHEVFVDRPVEKGGSDRGPLGGEYLLISLGGCFLSTLLAAIRTRGAEIDDVHVDVEGVVDDTPERYVSIAMRVRARHRDRDLVAKLVEIAERGCLVTNTLRRALPIAVEIAP